MTRLRFAWVWTAMICAGCNHLGGGASVHLPDQGAPARDFLVDGESEDPQYGSYSYLLFGAAPNTDTVAQYRSAAEAFLGLNPAAALRRYFPGWQLHMSYVPVLGPVPRALVELKQRALPGESAREASIDDMLRIHDYARATRFLRDVGVTRGAGPFIVTASVPLSELEPGEPVLVQDFSSFTPALVGRAVSATLQESTRNPPTTRARLRSLLLHARDFCGRLGANVQQLAHAVYEVASDKSH